MEKFRRRSVAVVLVPLLIVLTGCASQPVKQSWVVDYKYVDFDPFPGLDVQGRNVTLTQSEINGRVIWNLWSGDNAGFWNWLAMYGFGTGDLLKMVTSPRNQRFQTYGIVNQPGFTTPSQPDQYGLFIDVPREPGSKFDIDRRIDIPTYGISSGVMGLRLFPNPNFGKRGPKWDATRFWNDRNFYTDPQLERPYMVGMACSFCHIGPDPVKPPADPNEPEDFGNLSDYVGQHYLKVWNVFGHELPSNNFIKQLLMTNPAGSLDTAFIATDYLNNPGTMNAVYNIPKPGRVAVAQREEVIGGAADLRNLEYDPAGQRVTVLTPRVLKEGADSVGLNGALSRVYLNIGEYWEEWFRHFRPLIGIKKQSPIEVKVAQKYSPAWNWSENASPDLGSYLMKFAVPHKLKDAPGGLKYLQADKATLDRGKRAFARNCARCHSSKRPPADVDANSEAGRKAFEELVMRDDFLDGNYLGSEERIKLTEVRTNATRAVATNGLRGQVWDNFTSETYKTLPPVGAIDVYDPITKTTSKWTVPANGRGYYRPPSLVSVWSGAPFLHHNALGKHVHGVSVEKRMAAFDDSIHKLLYPERRAGAQVANTDGADGQSTALWKTTVDSSLQVPATYVHSRLVRWLIRKKLKTAPDGFNYFEFGYIPQGTPVNLLANTNLELNGIRKAWRLAGLLLAGARVENQIRKKGLTGDAAAQAYINSSVPKRLYQLNSCPDFVEDGGHYFGTELPPGEKEALIEYLKTF